MIRIILRHKQAWESLKKKPGFVLTILTTMGITIGALLCALKLNYLLLVEPLPYPEQDRLYVAEHGFIDAKKKYGGATFTYPGLVHLYKSKLAFEQSALMLYAQGVIGSHSNQPLVNTTFVTPELHQILDSPMALGRRFDESEDVGTNNPVAILSYNTWMQEFNGNRNILDQKININGVSFRVIGVLAKHFIEPEIGEVGRITDVWLPWDFNPVSPQMRQSFSNIDERLKYIGRLKSDISQEQAQQILTPLVSNRWVEGVVGIDFFNGWSIDVRVRPVKEVIHGDSESIAVMLLAGVIGLVLIAFANISNLFMSRTAEKQRQMAIQAAIGATRRHLFEAMLAETGLLMFLATLIALVFAKIGFYIMQVYLGVVLPRVSELALDPIIFGSAALVAIAFAMLFAKLSTRMIDYRALNTALQSSGKGSGLQVSKRVRHVLIASQVALATVLVFANFSLLREAVKTINSPIGFRTDNISNLVLSYASTDIPSEKETIAIMSEFVEKLKALPQLESLSQSNSPLKGFGIITLTKLSSNERYTPRFKQVDHRYFDLIEQPFMQGENFSLTDRREGLFVMIVNYTFAKQLQADGDVIGMQVSLGGPRPRKIIGVVRDISIPGDTTDGSAVVATGVPRVYIPNSLGIQTFMIKFKENQTLSRQELSQLISEVDPRYTIFSFGSTSKLLSNKLFAEITTAITTSVLASLVFLLAGIGLYGVLSYGIQLRRFEFGTRMAIGAKRKHLIYLVFGDNSKAVMLGFLGSAVLFFLAYISLKEYMQMFISWQVLPIVFITPSLIALVTLFSCYWPLRVYINRPPVFSLRGND